MQTGADELDDRPTWAAEEGEELVPGWRAWELLGRGHRCETWLAWSAERWCTGVVKLARPHQVAHPRARDTLRREARALLGNAHPALPILVHDGSGHPHPHLVLGYVDGPALDELVEEEGVLDPTATALLGLQLLGALVAVHRRGLTHLDLKPDNVMVDEGRPVLVDFGSSRAVGARREPDEPIGTPGYQAPELEAGARPDPAQDVFGLGATLAEAMTGLRPDREARAAVERWPLHTLPPGPVPDVVRAMLGEDPLDRPVVSQALGLLAAALPEDSEPWPRGVHPAVSR